MNYFKDLFLRLCISWRWIVAQFVGIPLLILVAYVWARVIKEKNLWEVVLTLLLPLLMMAAVLALQAGTMRRLAGDGAKRVNLAWGASSLLVWAIVVWATWVILDWCDDQIPLWTSYLNSRSPARLRGGLFTYDHIQRWLTVLEWVLRWIVMPAKVIPLALATSLRGRRFQFGRALRILWNWRWWPAVVLAALLAVKMPEHFFVALPQGTVAGQIWHVGLKLAATYLLGVGCWLLVLAWLAVLWSRQPEPDEKALDQDLFRRLRTSRGWIAALFGWTVLADLDDLFVERLPDGLLWPRILAILILLPLAIFLATGTIRSLMSDEARRIRTAWGALSMVLWAVLVLGVNLLFTLWYIQIAPLVLGWVVAPAIILPFAASSALWGFRLPWRKILRLLLDWRWWLGVLCAGIVGGVLPSLIFNVASGREAHETVFSLGPKLVATDVLALGSWVLILGWLAVLFARQQKQPPTGKSVSAPILTGPGDKSMSAKAEVPPQDEAH